MAVKEPTFQKASSRCTGDTSHLHRNQHQPLPASRYSSVRIYAAAASSSPRFPIRSCEFLRVSAIAAPPWVLHRSLFPSPDRHIPFTLGKIGTIVSFSQVVTVSRTLEPKSLPLLISTQSPTKVVHSRWLAVLSTAASVRIRPDSQSPTESTAASGCGHWPDPPLQTYRGNGGCPVVRFHSIGWCSYSVRVVNAAGMLDAVVMPAYHQRTHRHVTTAASLQAFFQFVRVLCDAVHLPAYRSHLAVVCALAYYGNLMNILDQMLLQLLKRDVGFK
uniref:Uncharacterized protein n=1 Tax=Oryza nivara TaxID=4536 RepID=A0A0E0II26_ORYNI